MFVNFQQKQMVYYFHKQITVCLSTINCHGNIVAHTSVAMFVGFLQQQMTQSGGGMGWGGGLMGRA